MGVNATLEAGGLWFIPRGSEDRFPFTRVALGVRTRGARMSRKNYFNTLSMAGKLEQLGQCRFMDRSEFNGVEKLRGKKVVIVGCGAQGLN